MANIQLFKIGEKVEEIHGSNVTLESELQQIIEANMRSFFGVTFLASEYPTTHGGRMDSIGIDENYCPVIFEYKRKQNENVINQGLYYLDWLLKHKDSFKVLVIEKLGLEKAKLIDWSLPRVICIAGDFNKYDESAINQMTKSVSLIRYKLFNDMLMFEQVGEHLVDTRTLEQGSSKITHKNFDERLTDASETIQKLFEKAKEFILSLGDDISIANLKYYTAFKKIKNFASIVLVKSKMILNLKLDVGTVNFEAGFSRDVTNLGRWGSGNVEVSIKNDSDFEKVKPLIERAYKEN
ncbi:MAG: DUF5655 domain-containing protein [Defluviitaleaceae bacterium]|nr:DUF5655 domain-containing protein [Defluviitaleaceae bacterium]